MVTSFHIGNYIDYLMFVTSALNLVRSKCMQFCQKYLKIPRRELSFILRRLIVNFVLIFVIACESTFFPSVYTVKSAIAAYKDRMELVDLGDSKEKFIELVYSEQQNLPMEHTRPPTKYYKDNMKVEVYFVRSAGAWVTEGEVSSDEFTPYLFIDEILVAIGWPAVEEFEN